MFQPDLSNFDLFQLLTEREAADFLNNSQRTLQGWRARSTGPRYKKMGKGIRYMLGDLLDFIKESTVVPNELEEKRIQAARAAMRESAGYVPKRGRPRKQRTIISSPIKKIEAESTDFAPQA